MSYKSSHFEASRNQDSGDLLQVLHVNRSQKRGATVRKTLISVLAVGGLSATAHAADSKRCAILNLTGAQGAGAPQLIFRAVVVVYIDQQ